MDQQWHLVVWFLLPLVLGVYFVVMFFSIHANVRICRARIVDLSAQVAELQKQVEGLKELLKSRY